MAEAAAAAESEAAAAAEVAAGEEERRKLFVGGVSSDTREDDLRAHFERYGEVRDVFVVRDRFTRHARGFAFVAFAASDSVDRAIEDKESHVVGDRVVEVERARPRAARTRRNPENNRPGQHHFDQNRLSIQGPVRDVYERNFNFEPISDVKKIFVGGLRNTTENELREYFKMFGNITDVVVVYDTISQRSRGFGFVEFDSAKAVEKVLERNFHELNGMMVEVKMAISRQSNHYHNNRKYGPRSFDRNNYNQNNEGLVQQNDASHAPLYSYMQQPLSPYQYTGGGYGVSYPIGGYPGYGYRNMYPPQIYPMIPASMVAGQAPVPYGSVGMYPSYINGASGAGYMMNAGNGYGTVDRLDYNSGSFDNNSSQANVGAQITKMEGTMTSQLAALKLDC